MSANTYNCSHEFTVDTKLHARLVHLMSTGKVEYGGNTVVHQSDRNCTLTLGEMVQGQFDHVDLPRGIVDWHTHPRTCRARNDCTVGLPSPSDMENVVLGHAMGNLAHMVYSSEGVYVLMLRPSIKSNIRERSNISALSVSKQVRADFDVLFKQIERDSKRYPTGIPLELYTKWKGQWYDASTKVFTVSFFSYHTIPRFMVHGMYCV